MDSDDRQPQLEIKEGVRIVREQNGIFPVQPVMLDCESRSKYVDPSFKLHGITGISVIVRYLNQVKGTFSKRNLVAIEAGLSRSLGWLRGALTLSERILCLINGKRQNPLAALPGIRMLLLV